MIDILVVKENIVVTKDYSTTKEADLRRMLLLNEGEGS